MPSSEKPYEETIRLPGEESEKIVFRQELKKELKPRRSGKRKVIFSVIFLAALAVLVWKVKSEFFSPALSLLPLAGNQESEDKTVLLFVGDIMLSRQIGFLIAKNGPDYPFVLIKNFLKNADWRIANLENPISQKGIKVGSIYSFRADPKTVDGLRDAGFNTVSLANNHIWDYGREAVLETLDILQKNKIDFVGAGKNFSEAHAGTIKEMKGTKIGFLGYTNLISPLATVSDSNPAVAFLEEKQMLADISELKKKTDLIVVILHWGDEYQTKHNIWQEKVAKKLIEAGADLIVGHHPHVAQEVEKYQGGYIAYSLGNFVFDQNFSPDTQNGLILKVIIQEKKISQVHPVAIKFSSSFQPHLVE